MAGWIDYLPDWSSSDALTLNSELKGVLALTKAVNERSVVAGLSSIAEPLSLKDLKSTIPSLNSRVKQLIPLFVNHTDNSGNWQGKDEIPMWTESEIKNYGTRPDGSIKGLGYFGEIYNPDGTFSTEISINVDNREIPTLVPTLTNDEVRTLQAGGDIPQTIIDKAVAYADYRESLGKSVFAEDGEQNPRSWMITLTSRFTELKFWLYQQYKIINLLLWVKEYTDSFNIIDFTGNGGWHEKRPWHSWIEVIDLAIATVVPYSNNILGANTNHYPTMSLPAGSAYNGKGKIQFPATSSISIDKEYDLYLFLSVDTQVPPDYRDIYDDSGRGYASFKYNLMESGSLAGGAILVSAEYGGEPGEYPKYPNDGDQQWSKRGWQFLYSYLVLKFNVPGGFEFIEET